jgi:hypothetical protein
MNYKLSDNAKAIAAKIAASRAQFAEMYKPKTWLELNGNAPAQDDLLAALLTRNNVKQSVIKLWAQLTTVQFDQKLNMNSWSFDPDKKCIFVSRDIWEKKDLAEFNYQMYAAYAQVLAYELFNETHRGFYWRLCFYALGFNPLRDLEERKAIEATATAILSKGELPSLKSLPPTNLKLGVKPNVSK